MKIFLDTSMIEEIEAALPLGVLNGVTTNPSLLKASVEKLKSGGATVNIEDYIRKICAACGPKRPVSLEVISLRTEEMIREGILLYEKFNAYAKNVVVKIPVNPSLDGKDNAHGLRAISELSSRAIPVNTTLIFTPEQALLAAKAGAVIVSPFAGRIDDLLRTREKLSFEKTDYFPAGGMKKGEKTANDNGIASGVDLIKKTVEIFNMHGIKSEVLAASIRNARQARECAMAGAHISSVPFYVLEDMLKHEKTKEGTAKFAADTVEEYRSLFGDKK